MSKHFSMRNYLRSVDEIALEVGFKCVLMFTKILYRVQKKFNFEKWTFLSYQLRNR